MEDQEAVVNQTEIRVVGMSRSGNHAIINWILKQTQGPFCFLNCAEPNTNPFSTARPLASGLPYETNIGDFDLEQEGSGNFTQKKMLLHSYEDTFLRRFACEVGDTSRNHWVGPSRRRIDIIILRDLFNLFASRMKFGMFSPEAARLVSSRVTPRTALRIWKQHARQFLGERQMFPGEWIGISYNKWTQSEEYRRYIAMILGIRFTDDGFNEIADCAGGSSFDGLPQGITRLNVHDRWRSYSEDPEYRSLFDDEALSLCQEVFQDDLSGSPWATVHEGRSHLEVT